MKKFSLLFFVFCLFAAFTASAQEYKTGIGAKFYVGDGTAGGLNVKHSLTRKTAVEGSLLFYSGSVGLEGLYELQGPIGGAEGLQYFVGGGALLGFGHNVGFALRLTGGLDYKFTEAPISVSLGLDPTFALAPSTNARLNLGIGFRYILP